VLASKVLTGAANNIDIVYSCDPAALKDADAIAKLLKEGTIRVGIESKDNKVAGYRLPDSVKADDKALSEFIKTKSGSGDLVYLAAQQNLMGATPTGALYTTSSPQAWTNH
jgi:hypothetical protein